MAVLGEIPGQGPLVDFEASHVVEWHTIAGDEETRRWEHLWRDPAEDPEARRQGRRDMYGGATWEDTVSHGWDIEGGGGMYRDVVLTDGSDGPVLAVLVLQGAKCPQWWDPAVSVGYAVSPMLRGDGIGTDLLKGLPGIITGITTVEHVIGWVCTHNIGSRHVLGKAGWELVGTDDCELRHSGSPRAMRCWKRSARCRPISTRSTTDALGAAAGPGQRKLGSAAGGSLIRARVPSRSDRPNVQALVLRSATTVAVAARVDDRTGRRHDQHQPDLIHPPHRPRGRRPRPHVRVRRPDRGGHRVLPRAPGSPGQRHLPPLRPLVGRVCSGHGRRIEQFSSELLLFMLAVARADQAIDLDSEELFGPARQAQTSGELAANGYGPFATVTLLADAVTAAAARCGSDVLPEAWDDRATWSLVAESCGCSV